MKKLKTKRPPRFIETNEQDMATRYFTMSNTAMLEVVGNGSNIGDMYRRADDIMVNECGCSLREEFNSWKDMIDVGDPYCFEEWQKIRFKYVKVEVTA